MICFQQSGTSGGSAVHDPPHLRQSQSQSQQQRHLLDSGNQRAHGSVLSSGSDSGSQPVEFDHAISYVNKIKVGQLVLKQYCFFVAYFNVIIC